MNTSTSENDSMYVVNAEFPLQQGDILLAGMVRLTSPQNVYIPTAWAGIDTNQSQMTTSKTPMPSLGTIGGPSLVMVLSHDCHLDKDLQRKVRDLLKKDSELTEEQAFELAEQDSYLDRQVFVAPVVSLDQISSDSDENYINNVIAGKTLGYFSLKDEHSFGFHRAVVDLNYRSTVDVFTLTKRITSLSDSARMQLRYALAKMDSLRAPILGPDFKDAIGQKIIGIHPPKKGSPTVKLVLENGKTLEVLLPAEVPDTSGFTRKKPRKPDSK